MHHHPKRSTTQFLVRAIVSAIQRQTAAGFTEQEMRRLQCSYCRDGWPLRDDGQHELLGAVVPCEAIKREEV